MKVTLTSVRAAIDSHLSWRGVLVLDEVLAESPSAIILAPPFEPHSRRSYEIIEHIDLPLPGARQMPVLAKLAATANIRHGQNRVVPLAERHHHRAEERVDGDAESAVS